MASVVRLVFGCCIRSRSPNPEEPDERTPFIQPTDEVPPIRTYTVDHDRMKERLGTIVRSKEGKMVNVNQPLPFNMHGRPSYARPDRSLSANTTPPRASSSTAPTEPALDFFAVRGHPSNARIPSYSPSREPSPSIQTSHSTSSLQPGDASYLPPEADPDGGHKRPILNVRLVRGAGGFTSVGRPRQAQITTRGRSGRPGEERAEENGSTAEGSGDPVGKGKAATNGANGVSSPTSSPTVEVPGHPGSSGAAAHNGDGSDTERRGDVAAQGQQIPTSALDPEFNVDDVGDITQSWGD